MACTTKERELFKEWLAERCADSYDESDDFERGLRAAYQDAFIRLTAPEVLAAFVAGRRQRQ